VTRGLLDTSVVIAIAAGEEPGISGRNNLGSLATTYAAVEAAQTRAKVDMAGWH